MPNPPKILAFAGSARQESFNKQLIKIAVDGARKAGAEVTHIDLRDYPLPLYDQDLEAKEGLPENVEKIKQLMIDHQGFLISSPEYNSSITPLLKNTLDWASRKSSPNEPPLIAYKGKVAGLMSASPGGLGGLRSLIVLRSMLGNIGVLVLPTQKSIPQANQAFNPDGTLKDPKQQEEIFQLAKALTDIIKKLY